jgi:cytochrome b
MRAFRKPFVEVHEFGFYALLVFGAIHILAVVMTEIREGGGLVSAMITGCKTLSGPPADQR